MNNLPYIIAVIIIIGWMVGFFVFHAGRLINALLIIAFITIILRIVRSK